MSNERREFWVSVPEAQADTFARTLEQFPQLEVRDLTTGVEDPVVFQETYVKRIQEKGELSVEKVWKEELASLARQIEDVKEGIEIDDSEVIKGFDNLYKGVIHVLSYRDRRTTVGTDNRTFEGFCVDVISLFKSSHERYRNLKNRPVRIQNKRGNLVEVYAQFPGALTPRHIRTLIWVYGLDAGKPKKVHEIGELEGLKGEGLIDNAHLNLIQKLT